MSSRTSTHIVKEVYFYEGPPQRPSRMMNPNRVNGDVRANIDTRAIDGFRQGVELTLQKHYDMGTVKIHAGEPDHVLRQTRFGMDLQRSPKNHAYSDNSKFDPVKFIKSQDEHSYLYSSIFTMPIVIDDNDEVTTDNFDGVIEPLSIREVVGFTSLEAPFIAHDIKASIAGADDVYRGAAPIVQLDYFYTRRDMVVYVDGGYFKNEFAKSKPFADTSTFEGDIMGVGLFSALAKLKPSSGNFVPPDWRSMTAGWDFDSNVKIGTDSITFGGRTY